ncbi:MAG: hypothetical protein SF097_20400 [Acidobacteriota bacterium]|nr:hypothetical protein [Acidobacteriota bacterium]
MTTFLFWNLGKKPLAERLLRIAHSYSVDVLILAECEIAPGLILETLNHQSFPMFHYCPGQCEKIAIYSRFSGDFLVPRFESDRITIRRLSLLDTPEILLAATHLPSKLHSNGLDQYESSRHLSTTIR